ncbi:MAG: M20/M25/M40 family metallo-hydrolase [Thermaerobacter sp.]|nr:M20/M25/M40 family metallo-hydrolase [Thermaerobacter sp.]
MTTREWLTALTAIHAASGCEDSVRDYLEGRLAPFADRVTTDGAGNLIAWRDGPKDKPLLLIAAHIDQVALYVQQVIAGGYLRLRAPAIDVRCLPGLTVEVGGRPGVIGMLPPHLRRGNEGEKPVQEDDLYIDIGVPGTDDVPPVGTPVYFRIAPRSVGPRRFSAPGLDNRASVAALCRLLEALQGKEIPVRLACAFTVGEEIGRAGAAFLGTEQQPDLALAVDVTFARQPDLPGQDFLMELGSGPAIGVGPNVPLPVESLICSVAEQARIPAQREPLPGDSGTDGWALQVAGLGVPTGVISIPLTSMHSPAEVVDVQDVENTAELLTALARTGFGREDLPWD